MKQLIIIFMSIMLGIYIYGLILGDGDDTIQSAARQLMVQQIENQKMVP